MNSARCLYSLLAALSLLLGCVTPSAESHSVAVVTYEMTDDASNALIFRTLRRHGIECIGVSKSGWCTVNVPERQSAQARVLLSELNSEGRTFRVIGQ